MWVEFELNSSMGEGFSVLLMQRDGRKKGGWKILVRKEAFLWGRGYVCKGRRGYI